MTRNPGKAIPKLQLQACSLSWKDVRADVWCHIQAQFSSTQMRELRTAIWQQIGQNYDR